MLTVYLTDGHLQTSTITTKAMGLISSLFNIALSWDVPFSNIRILPKLTFVLPCSQFLSPLLHTWRFAVALLHGFMENFVTAVIAEVFIALSFCLKRSVKCKTTLITKSNHRFAFSLWLIDCLFFSLLWSLLIVELQIFPYTCSYKKVRKRVVTYTCRY